MEKSAVAQHCLLFGTPHIEDNLKIVKEVNSKYYLNAWETYFINCLKKEDVMNTEESPTQSSISHPVVSKLNSKLINYYFIHNTLGLHSIILYLFNCSNNVSLPTFVCRMFIIMLLYILFYFHTFCF